MHEIDACLTTRPELRHRVFEAHPELAFMRLVGSPIHTPKRTKAGRELRARVLQGLGFREVTAQLERLRKRYGLKSGRLADDDGLDAVAVCITAQRIWQGTALTLPECPHRDVRGITMAIHY
jgi:predicted RNase H-like nuclease